MQNYFLKGLNQKLFKFMYTKKIKPALSNSISNCMYVG